MEKIIRNLVFCFILLVIFPVLSLIIFQKIQMEIQPPVPPPPIGFDLYEEEIPMQNIQPQAPPMSVPIAILVLSCSVFSFIWFKYLNKIFISPLKNILKGVEEFDNGNLNVKFETNSDNEYIIKTFSTLNKLVENTREKEKLKSNFIQNIVHDLRAPILAQDRALEILKDEFDNHELVLGMKENTQNYINMINLILEFYKSKSLNTKIEKTEIKLSGFVENIISELKPLAEKKNIKIKVENIPTNMIVYADYISLTRIITNLIVNSIENIENNKTITIKAHKRENTVISIEDNGQGIEEEKIKTLFERYSSSSKTKVVSGLGLNIVKELVEKNDGKIEVESEIGAFTKFTIDFANEDK